MTSDDDFDWCSDPTVVLPEQPPLAVYTNGHGGIVIRMGGDVIQNYDQVVIIRPENALGLCRAILAEAGIDVELVRGAAVGTTDKPAPLMLSKSAPLSNAERQRRFKEKQRRAEAAGNGGNDGGNDGNSSAVTDGDGQTWPDELPLGQGVANG